VRIGGEGGNLFLCVDCNLKYEQAQTLEFERLALQQNYLIDQMEAMVGVPGANARYELPKRPVYRVGDTTLNNITVDRSNIGILNTGSIGTVDGAVTVLKRHGDDEAARALVQLTEAVVTERQIGVEQKNQILELLSVLSTEAAAPKEQRRSAGMKQILLHISTLVGGAAGLLQLWQQLQPAISALFE